MRKRYCKSYDIQIWSGGWRNLSLCFTNQYDLHDFGGSSPVSREISSFKGDVYQFMTRQRETQEVHKHMRALCFFDFYYS